MWVCITYFDLHLNLVISNKIMHPLWQAASGERRAASGNGNDQGCGKGQNPDFLHNFAKNKPILKIQTAILLKISQAIGL